MPLLRRILYFCRGPSLPPWRTPVIFSSVATSVSALM